FVVLAWSDGPWLSVLVGGVAVAGFGGIYTLVTSDLIGRMPPSSVSMAAGVVASAQSLALIIANPLIGRSVDAYGDYTVAIVVLALWVLPGSLVWHLWRPRTIDLTRATGG
ncbi:MAG: hypothetical protein NT062_38555, partial [Proteobacteria bacterium]|nr:hypothetical protein [Pseudomonadota bacterium]